MNFRRTNFVSPEIEVNTGLFTLLAGATVFLGFRVWCKLSRRHGLWYDDYVLIASWVSGRILGSPRKQKQ